MDIEEHRIISYLGVNVDQLLQAFDASFSFSDNREERVYEEVYQLEEIALTDEEIAAIEAGEELVFDEDDLDADDLEDDDLDDELEDDEDDDIEAVFVDDMDRIHSLGETLAEAGESILGFLTDYVVADDVDDEWMTLNQARGALLALRIAYPELEEFPEAACAYSFTIARDSESGLPTLVSMKVVPDEDATESLTRSKEKYEGVINDDTILDDLFEDANIPEDEQDFLGDAIEQAVNALASEQCGLLFDVRAFCNKLNELAKNPAKLTLVEDSDNLQ